MNPLDRYHQDTNWLLDELVRKTESGYSCLPLIGAGFSAPSGAPLVSDLTEYLQGCICAALGLFDGDKPQDGSLQNWHPRTDAWPMPISQMQIRRGYWEDKLFEQITALRGNIFTLRKGDVSKKIEYRDTARKLRLYSEALGAMQDWRTSLLLLSRLTTNPTDRNEVRLSAPRAEVVDRFFREVMAGKRPSLGHRMLGALAPSLGIDMVLTTNFDDLLEKGFSSAGVELNVFEVPSRGQLPELAAITAGDTLIKLHGGRTSLRADYSLDEIPSKVDDATFLSYLKAAPKNTVGSYVAKKYLLVIGFSGDDERIRHFVEEAMTHFQEISTPDDQGAVYWLCYTTEDEQQLEKHFAHQIRQELLVPVRSTRTDFFLLELYQSLHQALPPLVGVFPSVPRTALPWRIPKYYLEEVNLHGGPKFTEELRNCVDGVGQADGVRCVIASGEEQSRGLVSLCAQEFERNESDQGRLPLWLDLNDVSGALNLYEVLLEAIHFKLGIEDWVPSATVRGIGPNSSFVGQARELHRLLSTTQKRWIIFLNARETPGANIYEPDGEKRMPPNGWLDWRTCEIPNWDDKWYRENSETANFDGFINLINALYNQNSNVTFVVICHTHPQANLATPNALLLGPCNLVEYKPEAPLTTSESVWQKCADWIAADPEKEQFVRVLSLMQRPRFPASLWSDAFWSGEAGHADLDTKERSDRLRSWIEILESYGLIRIKPGGMVTLVTSCRSRIRKELCKPTIAIAKAHYRLGVWYDSLLDISGAAPALFETVYHFCKSAEVSIESVLSESVNANVHWCISRAASAMEAAAAKISAESFLIQTHGQSRGSCRQLERLCDVGEKVLEGMRTIDASKPATDKEAVAARKRLESAVQHLWLACTEAMRSIAREVGEDGKAYERQRQVAHILLNHSWKETKELSDSKKAKSVDAEMSKPRVRPRSLSSQILGSRKLRKHVKWRWVRWNVMLATASRSYSRVENTLHGEKSILGRRAEFASEPRYKKEPLTNQQERIEMLRLIEEAVQIHLLEFSLHQRIQTGSPKDQRELLRDIDALIQRGLRLATKIKMTGSSSDSSELKTATWGEARLLMHLSIVHSRALEVDYHPRVERDALGILANAEARLHNVSPGRIRSEKALTDLHRAEVRMRTVEVTEIQKLLTAWRGGTLPALKIAENTVAHARVAVAQSISYLDAAEPVLRERRRNVWWTTWYCERKLKAIAYSVLLGAGSEGESIPFLGLEAAMRDTETEADRLLGEASRMIRIDAYRLATILDAYVDCYFALVAKLAIDLDSTRLPIRLSLMKARISEACVLLESIYLVRNRHPSLDKGVQMYIESTLERVKGDLERTAFAQALSASVGHS